MKLLTIVDAQPQSINEAFLSRKIAKNMVYAEILVRTGQRYGLDMSDTFLKVSRYHSQTTVLVWLAVRMPQ